MPLSLPALPSITSISLPNVGGLLGGAVGSAVGQLAAGSSPTPASQKSSAAPMTFRLHDQTDPSSSPTDLTLYVRPEEFSKNYSSRLAQHHTEGGSFIDSFGPGTTLITMSGTMGWRNAAGSGLGGATADGFDRFVALYNQVFAGWHTARAEAVKKGKDPALVKLILADSLHRYANVVAPQSFSLRRSKSRPLLLAYQLQLIVVEKSLEKVQPTAASSSSSGLFAGIASLTGSIKAIGDMAKGLQNVITGTLLNPIRGFVSLTTGLYNQVASTAASIVGIPASLASAAHLTAQAGSNIFRSLAVIEGLPASVRGQLMQIGAEYTNVQCVLSNSLKQQATYTDYSPLYGASNCSSTNGGDGPSPLADQNPFFAVVPPASASAGVSSITIDAQAALRALAKADVVASPVPTLALTGLVTSINAGLTA